MSHQTPITIYYEDTDAGGVVYHANYIKYGERARTEFLKAIGYRNSQLAKDPGIMFVVRRIEADYLKPAFLEDELTVYTHVESTKSSSMVMRHVIRKGDTLMFQSDVTLVCVDQKTVKPVKIPVEIKERFVNYGR